MRDPRACRPPAAERPRRPSNDPKQPTNVGRGALSTKLGERPQTPKTPRQSQRLVPWEPPFGIEAAVKVVRSPFREIVPALKERGIAKPLRSKFLFIRIS